MKIASSECLHQLSSAELAETSFEIAHMIVQEKKKHNVSKILIKILDAKSNQSCIGGI